jgi:RNA polymerase sigma-70 factor (ECF subfamily)
MVFQQPANYRHVEPRRAFIDILERLNIDLFGDPIRRCYSGGGREVMTSPTFVQTDRMDTPSRRATSTIDPALLGRIAKGDQQAFSQLYDHSSALLYTVALRILGSRDEADELLQDVYLEVWRKVARYDVGRGTPVAWLITLTRSRAIDRLRARAARGQHVTTSLDNSPVGHMADMGPSPFETQADQELRMAVGTAITSLPTAQQQAIELAYYEGLSHNEIASRLNQPLGTVKTRIKLGMSKLRDTLRHCWELGDLE